MPSSRTQDSAPRAAARVLLIQPPNHPESVIGGTMEPLALETLAGALRADPELGPACRIEILDLRVEAPAALERTLARFRPHLAGVTGITIDYPCQVEVAARVKRFDPAIVTVVGGHHATMAPADYCLPVVDYVVRGQGITVLPRLVKYCVGGGAHPAGKGLLTREENRLVGEAELFDFEPAELPRPARDLTTAYRRRYRFQGHTWGLSVTSQGCPFRCSFCACWKVNQGRYTARSPEEVVEDLEAIPEPRVFLGDDHTFGHAARAEAIADLLLKRGVRKQILAYSRADAIAKHPELYRKWARVGLYGLTVGFEAMSSAELDKLNKSCSVETNELANRILADCGIHNYAHLILKPEYQRADFERVWQYIYRLGIIKPVIPVLTPLPGTDLRAQHAPPLVDEHPYYDLAHPLLETALPPAEVCREAEALFRKSYGLSRWVKARAKGLVNRVRPGRYAWHETRAPEWYFIPVMRYWVKQELGRAKLAPFLAKVEAARRARMGTAAAPAARA